MTRDNPLHDDYKLLGRKTRGGVDLVDVDPRAAQANHAKARAKIRTRYANGNDVPDDMTQTHVQKYLQQFDDVSDRIRTLVRGDGNADVGLRTPREIVNNVGTPLGYFVVEWRIRPVNPAPDPPGAGCGCGCGCGCGG